MYSGDVPSDTTNGEYINISKYIPKEKQWKLMLNHTINAHVKPWLNIIVLHTHDVS